MTGFAAIAMCAAFTSCSHDFDFDQSSVENAVQSKYEAAFIKAFGQPAADQDWGFGTTRGITRGATFDMPDNPTFRDNLAANISKPTMPTSYYTTVTDVKKYVTYAKSKDWNSWEEGAVVYVDADYAYVNDKKNQTIYIVGNVTYESSTATGIVFVVTEGSTLKIKGFGQYNSVYLAAGAKLDISEHYSWNSGVTIDNGALYMNANSLVEGANLTIKESPILLESGSKISVVDLAVEKGSVLWNEGSITLTGEFSTQNENVKIYNPQNHKIKANKLTMHNNNELLYNDGEVEITGAIATENTGGEIVNNGTLKGASLSFKAGGKMHNVGTTVITGKTHIANSQTQWKNEGQFTTGDFEVSDYAEQVFNNCKLTVHKTDNTGEFKIYGKFVLEGGDANDPTSAGASVVTDKVYWVNNSFVFLGTKSLFKVNGQFLTANYDINAGMVGYGDGYAVVQAESIVRPSEYANKQFGMTYKGKLFVDAGTHFAQGAEDPANNPPSQPYYKYDSTVKFKHLQDASPVSIPSSTCNPGYGTTIIEETYDGRIMAEDLTASEFGDFDFNDVVFDYKLNNDETATIKLRAAGGTLELYVGGTRSEDKTTITGGYEVHQQFGVPVNQMVNTGVTSAEEPAAFNVACKDNDPVNIMIWVKKQGIFHELTAHQGMPASKFRTECTSKWCDEYISISNPYPTFKDWVIAPGEFPEWATTNFNLTFADKNLNNNAGAIKKGYE